MELADRKLKEWRSRVIRELLELENLAKHLRDELENGHLRLDQAEIQHGSSDLCSHVMAIETYVDRATGLAEAGIW